MSSEEVEVTKYWVCGDEPTKTEIRYRNVPLCLTVRPEHEDDFPQMKPGKPLCLSGRESLSDPPVWCYSGEGDEDHYHLWWSPCEKCGTAWRLFTERDDHQSYYKLPTDGAEPSFHNTDFLDEPLVQNWLRLESRTVGSRREHGHRTVESVIQQRTFKTNCFTDTPPTFASGSESDTDEPSQLKSSFMDFILLLVIIALVGCLLCAVDGCIMKLRKTVTTPSNPKNRGNTNSNSNKNSNHDGGGCTSSGSGGGGDNGGGGDGGC